MTEPLDAKHELFKEIGVPFSGMNEPFDPDSDLIDYLCPPTDLDIDIMEKGHLPPTDGVFRKPKKQMKLLEHYSSNSEYIDFNGDIVGDVERGVKLTLTYSIETNSFHAVIEDTDDSNGFHQEIDSVPNDVAKFMIGEEEYNKLKEIHQEESDRNVKKKPVDELKQAFLNVLKLAKGGQQSWWTDKFKEDSDEAINTIEKYYNEKYNK